MDQWRGAGRGDRDEAGEQRGALRADYRERRDALVAALEEHFPGSRVSGIVAGLHAIAVLPKRFGSEGDLRARTAAAGVAVRLLADCTHARVEHDDVRLVLGYAHLAPARIREGVRLVAEAV